MWQVLFTIPVLGRDQPIFGYGTMLVLAFIASITWRRGGPVARGSIREVVYDLSALGLRRGA